MRYPNQEDQRKEEGQILKYKQQVTKEEKQEKKCLTQDEEGKIRTRKSRKHEKKY